MSIECNLCRGSQARRADRTARSEGALPARRIWLILEWIRGTSTAAVSVLALGAGGLGRLDINAADSNAGSCGHASAFIDLIKARVRVGVVWCVRVGAVSETVERERRRMVVVPESWTRF